MTFLPFLYHDAAGSGLPPIPYHRHSTLSSSFTVTLVEQLITAVGFTEHKQTRQFNIKLKQKYALLKIQSTHALIVQYTQACVNMP